MAGHIEFGFRETTNLNDIHGSLSDISGAAKVLLQKIESSLQTSIGNISYRSDDCTFFAVRFGEEELEYPAVLAFDKKLYAWIGMPKMGDDVIVIHNNGNFAHILFTSNDKNINDPPYFGENTIFRKSISSSKCMG